MTSHIVPVNSGHIGPRTCPVVNARDLHHFLEVGKVFAAWICERIAQYGFTPSIDYEQVYSDSGKNPAGGRPAIDYHLSLDMAKELAMIERTPRGREARQYFIRCERELLALQAGEAPLGAPASPPFNRLDSGLMRELRRTNPRLVQAYLVANGITPVYVAQLLGGSALPSPAGVRESAPLALVRERIDGCATAQTAEAWLLRMADFERLCEGYDALETARALRDLGYLLVEHGKLQRKAPRGLMPGRPYVYTIAKRLQEG